jgi:hypothetical protein
LIIAFSTKWQAIIALSFFVAFLIAVFYKFFDFFNSYLNNKTNSGYQNLATFSRYYTNDGDTITYESLKFIVCKSIILDKHEHRYIWTGSQVPNISSDTATVESTIKTEAGEFDKVIFKFKEPLLYNDFAVIHIRMTCDDADHQSKPQLESYVRGKLKLIEFKVELRHKKGIIKPARLYKRKIDTSANDDYKLIQEVQFDKSTSSYTHVMYNPPIGFAYKLSWDR